MERVENRNKRKISFSLLFIRVSFYLQDNVEKKIR